MNFPDLVGAHLKSDEIIEILEQYELDVIFDFDRLHEGVPDAYHSSAYAQGFELLFDEHQNLQTVFLYVQPRHGFDAFPADSMVVPTYTNIQEAKAGFEASGTEYIENTAQIPNQPGLCWIKGDFGSYTVHYEVRDDMLEMVTIAAISA